MQEYDFQNMSDEELRELILSTEVPERFDKRSEFENIVDVDLLDRIFNLIVDEGINIALGYLIAKISIFLTYGYNTVKYHLQKYIEKNGLDNLKEELDQ